MTEPSGPVALPALLAVLITGALWSVWRTPINHAAAAPLLAAVVRAVVFTFGLITYGLVITIIRNHLGVRRGVWGAPSALYGVAPRRLQAPE